MAEVSEQTIQMMIDGQKALGDHIENTRQDVQKILVGQASLEPQITQLREAVQFNGKTAASAHQKLESVREDVGTLKGDVSTLKSEHKTMKKKVAAVVTAITVAANGFWQWGKETVGF